MNPIWVGKFEVSGPRDNGILNGNVGAFLWIVAQAQSSSNFTERVDYAMRELGLTVVGSEQLQEVIDEDSLSEEIWDLLPQARRNVESVVCGTWHLFKNQDA